MTLKLRLALLGLLSISATLSTDRAAAAVSEVDPVACTEPCMDAPALPSARCEEAPQTAEARIIKTH